MMTDAVRHTAARLRRRQEAELVRRLAAAGLNKRQIAAELGRSITWVSARLRLVGPGPGPGK